MLRVRTAWGVDSSIPVRLPTDSVERGRLEGLLEAAVIAGGLRHFTLAERFVEEFVLSDKNKANDVLFHVLNHIIPHRVAWKTRYEESPVLVASRWAGDVTLWFEESTSTKNLAPSRYT